MPDRPSHYTGYLMQPPPPGVGSDKPPRPATVHVLAQGTANDCAQFWTQRLERNHQPTVLDQHRVTLVDLNALGNGDPKLLAYALDTDPALRAIAHAYHVEKLSARNRW